MNKRKIVYIVHCVDTEGPLYESLLAKFERIKEVHRKYREANPEKVREQLRRYKEANPEKHKEWTEYYTEHTT